jgi:hypothetical protein
MRVEPREVRVDGARGRDHDDGEQARPAPQRRGGQTLTTVAMMRARPRNVQARGVVAMRRPWRPVVKVWRRTETGEAPRWQGATTENTGSI